MRIRILSDLHLEFGVDGIADDVACDVVVLAGDIGTKTEAPRWAGEKFRQRSVVLVPGNHEFYGTSIAREEKALADASRTVGIACLAPGEVAIHGVRFLGATLWTDYRLRHDAPGSMALSDRSLNDHRLILDGDGDGTARFTPATALRCHQAERAWLASRLAATWDGPTVVVTHHAPSGQSIAPRYAGDLLSAAFASDLERMVGSSGAVLWIHGHTNGSADYVLGGMRVVANPRGYPEAGGFENPDFDAGLVVDI